MSRNRTERRGIQEEECVEIRSGTGRNDGENHSRSAANRDCRQRHCLFCGSDRVGRDPANPPVSREARSRRCAAGQRVQPSHSGQDRQAPDKGDCELRRLRGIGEPPIGDVRIRWLAGLASLAGDFSRLSDHFHRMLWRRSGGGPVAVRWRSPGGKLAGRRRCSGRRDAKWQNQA